ncbi:hypothetical protein V8G54_003216 [Vigna mungo]|uniref:Gnk2-homologous domain-containing protein n=1 Tax=Vigna mungo TaxID=3915 RepID=A0AAQ3PBN1_VIGMU
MFEFLFLSFLTFATTHASLPNPHGNPMPDNMPSPPRATTLHDYVYLNCSTDTIAGSVFQFNLDTLLRRLSNATTDNGFNKTTVTGEKPSDSVFGLFMCRADVPSQLCRQCVNKAAQQLALETMNKIADEAAHPLHPISAKKFATRQANVSGFQRLYCMAQCTPDLLSNDCSSSSPSNPQRPVPVPASKFSDADPNYLYHNCSADATADSDFNKDLDTLLSYLSSNATKSYYRDSVDDNAYGLFMCRGDLLSQLCQQCVLNATSYLFSRCNSSQEAIIWFSHCMLRYSNNYFFSHMEKSPMFQVLNVTAASSPIPCQDDFTYSLSTTLASLAKAAGDSPEKYVTESSPLNDEQTLYTLGQCTQDLSSEDCVRCLTDINGRIPWLNLGSVGGRILYPSCNIRFELFQFYTAGGDSAQGPTPSPPQGKVHSVILVFLQSFIAF